MNWLQIRLFGSARQPPEKQKQLSSILLSYE